MKTKKNKKYYNFTEKQKRKDYRPKRNFSSAPKSFVKMFSIKFKNECKMVLKNYITNGIDKPYPVHKKTAVWYYW